MFKCALHQVLCLCYYILYPNPPINLPVGGNLSARELKDACNRIKINTEGQLRGLVSSHVGVFIFLCKNIQFTGQKAEQPTSTAYLLARKMSLTGRSNSGQHAQMRYARGHKLQIFQRKLPFCMSLFCGARANHCATEAEHLGVLGFSRVLAYSFHMRNSKSPDGESNPQLRGEKALVTE